MLWIKSKGIWFYSREGVECDLWKAENTWESEYLTFLLHEGNVARLDSRILDHWFASRWEQKTCKHFFIFSYLVQSTAKYFRPVHPPCHTPNKIFYDNLLLLLLPLLLSLSPLGKALGMRLNPASRCFNFITYSQGRSSVLLKILLLNWLFERWICQSFP